jgi:hypothetical protein
MQLRFHCLKRWTFLFLSRRGRWKIRQYCWCLCQGQSKFGYFFFMKKKSQKKNNNNKTNPDASWTIQATKRNLLKRDMIWRRKNNKKKKAKKEILDKSKSFHARRHQAGAWVNSSKTKNRKMRANQRLKKKRKQKKISKKKKNSSTHICVNHKHELVYRTKNKTRLCKFLTFF